MSKYSAELINQIIVEYIGGQSLNGLATKYNIPYATIKHWLIKNCVPNNNTGRFYQRYEIKDDYAEIYIKFHDSYVKAIIDVDDVGKCKTVGIWSLTKDGYVINYKTGIYLHRLVMNCPDNLEIDHIYHNLLDNRKSQLRLATSSQQKMNTHIRKNNKSGYRGVYFDKERNTWNVHLKKDNQRICKRFKTLEEAIAFSKKKKSELQGEFEYKEGDYHD